jgi:hypothetical protein
MSEHDWIQVLTVASLVFSTLYSGALLLVLLSVRRETRRLFIATAGMVHQETTKLLEAIERRR